MNLRERLRALERTLEPQSAYLVIFVADVADQAAETARYRLETDYQGMVICMDETDARL
jgi:DNA integrity scanning protein DisA with diadenylate cyclase activity